MIAISCSKNETIKESDSDLLTSQVEKIEYFLADGARKEIITDPSIPKIETSASEELRSTWKDRIRKDVESSYNKRTVGILGPAINPNAFAVFKSGSCGGHAELEIKMDCEDRRPATSASGWTGDSYVDGGRDVHLKFCVIDDDYQRYHSNGSRFAFGYLYLGETWYFQTDPGQNTGPYPRGWSRYFWPLFSFIRVFDNEDSGTDNKVWVGGVEQPLVYWLGPTAHSQASYVSGNTRLHFIVSPENPSGGNFPPWLGLPGLSDFGLLGQFGNFQGNFNIDDEDTNNQNDGEVGGYYAHIDDATGQWVTNPFPHSTTIEGGSNTTMRLSRVH